MEHCPVTRVRTTCSAVARQAQQVRIHPARIAPYALSLPFEQLQAPEHHPARHYLGHGPATAAFFVTLDTINFGSGYFPHLRKRSGMSGYYTIASRLTDHYRDHGPLNAQQLADMTPARCLELFQQDSANAPVVELMHLFAQAWREMGRFLSDRFGGRFTALIEAAGHSALNLIHLLIDLPGFQDQAVYSNQPVYFYKRAQIMAADLALAFKGQGWGRFDDLDQLTLFADNLVPHVLRLDGVLEYAPDLAAQIDAGRRLTAGSAAEVEIRACALHAVENMRAALQHSGRLCSAMQLDYLLWQRGQQPEYKQARPRHRARCMFY